MRDEFLREIQARVDHRRAALIDTEARASLTKAPPHDVARSELLVNIAHSLNDLCMIGAGIYGAVSADVPRHTHDKTEPVGVE